LGVYGFGFVVYGLKFRVQGLEIVGWVERSETQHGSIRYWVSLHSTQPTTEKQIEKAYFYHEEHEGHEDPKRNRYLQLRDLRGIQDKIFTRDFSKVEP
jgi:hypothetical protein